MRIALFFAILRLLTTASGILVVTANLVDFFCRKSDLAYYVSLGLGEAIEEVVVVSKGNYVSDLIEEEVGVYCVSAERLVFVVKLAVTAVQHKSVYVVLQATFADTVELVIGDGHYNINRQINRVLAILDLTTYAFSFPIIPIGDV